MRTALFILLVLFVVPSSVFAQYREFHRDRDRRHSARDDAFELTPFGGYRYGGTLYSDQTSLFRTDVDIASAANFGVGLGIPIASSGMKLELMASRQNTHFKAGSGLFEPSRPIAGFDVTYYHGGLFIPLSGNRPAIPFAVVSAGVANLDPDIIGVSAENRFSASAGLGVKVPLNRSVAFRLEARGYYTSVGDDRDCFSCYYGYDRDLYQGETNVGLSIRF